MSNLKNNINMKKALLMIALVAFVASTTIIAQDKKAVQPAKTEKKCDKDGNKACCNKDKAGDAKKK